MKEVTKIKVGQVWVTKEGRKPFIIDDIRVYTVSYYWYEDGKKCIDSEYIDELLYLYDFVADSMSEEDFKEWCKTGKNPTLKSETQIKDDEIIHQSAPVAHDPINHPKHYTSHPSGIETIEITRHMNFNRGNAVKYLMRAGLKDPAKEVEDLQKAAWYIQDEIKRLSQQ